MDARSVGAYTVCVASWSARAAFVFLAAFGAAVLALWAVMGTDEFSWGLPRLLWLAAYVGLVGAIGTIGIRLVEVGSVRASRR